MQGSAGGRAGLLATMFQRAPNTSISNEKRMNLPPLSECLSTRHWPVFNDKAGVISTKAALSNVRVADYSLETRRRHFER